VFSGELEFEFAGILVLLSGGVSVEQKLEVVNVADAELGPVAGLVDASRLGLVLQGLN